MIVLFICLHVEIHPVGIHRIGLSVVLWSQFICGKINFSWTAIRCQKFDETVEESIPIDNEPSTTVPLSSTDWCNDADAWNTDDDGDTVDKKPSSAPPPPPPPPVRNKKEVEVMVSSMKIEDENEKSSSDEDDIEIDTNKKSNKKNISIASSDAFSEWKKTNLRKQTIDASSNATFPFYYIVIDDEEVVIDEAKLNEKKKLKSKVKKLQDIDEDDDDDDETTKGGKE